jgi:hypothetical protein
MKMHMPHWDLTWATNVFVLIMALGMIAWVAANGAPHQ